MKKIIISLILIVLLGGCWNYKELNDYSIVTGIAIDKDKDSYEVSVLISNLSKGSTNATDNKYQPVVYSAKANSIYKAIKNIGLIVPKEIYIGHFSILLISEEIAKEGIYNILDLFLRESSSKKNFYIAISKDNSAKDTLKIISPLNDFPSQNITENLLFTSMLQGKINAVNFNELLSNLIRSGVDPTISGIKVYGNEEKGGSESNLKSSEPKAYVKLQNLALFRGDKFIKWANEYESKGINLLNNKVTETSINTKLDDGYIVTNSTKTNTKISISLKNEIPVINIKVTGELKIAELNSNTNIKNDKTLKSINRKANKKIEKFIKDALIVCTKNNIDPVGFGLKFQQNYPDFYKKNKRHWNDLIKKAEIKVHSNLILKNVGSAENSLEAINEK